MLCLGSMQVYADEATETVFSEGFVFSKEGESILWKYVNRDRFTLILSGKGSMQNYAREYCSTYNWTPVAPWMEQEMCGVTSALEVAPGITSIGAYSFYGMRILGSVSLPEGLTSIGDFAFANCSMLYMVSIPDSVTEIGSNAFYNVFHAVICCSPNSYAHKYAKEKGISVKLINCSHEGKSWTETEKATCTETGKEELKCPVCGETLDTRSVPELGHAWGEWATVSKATFTAPEKQTRTCTQCSASEVRTVGSALQKVKVSSLKITGPNTLLTGKRTTLKLSVSPGNAANKAVTWSSSNTKYATVSSKGVVTAKAAGAGKTVTITARAKDGSGKKASLRIKIKGAVKKITLKAPKSLKAGKKTTVKATVTVGKGGSKALSWSSSKKYATVTSKGVVKALKAGKGKTVTIKAKAKDGSGKTATVKIKIN